jgi:hypothetical protein
MTSERVYYEKSPFSQSTYCGLNVIIFQMKLEVDRDMTFIFVFVFPDCTIFLLAFYTVIIDFVAALVQKSDTLIFGVTENVIVTPLLSDTSERTQANP